MNTSMFSELKSSQLERKLSDTYLRLQLEQQTSAVLPLKHIQEVLVTSVGRITPIPSMPACILGLMNQRSQVLWVVDLAQMLELQPINQDVQQYYIVIIRVGNMPLGLVVQAVKGVIRLTADAIESSREIVAPNLNLYLEGCVVEQKEILFVLNAEAIVNASILYSN